MTLPIAQVGVKVCDNQEIVRCLGSATRRLTVRHVNLARH